MRSGHDCLRKVVRHAKWLKVQWAEGSDKETRPHVLFDAVVIVDLVHGGESEHGLWGALRVHDKTAITGNKALWSKLPPVFSVRMPFFGATRERHIERHHVLEAQDSSCQRLHNVEQTVPCQRIVACSATSPCGDSKGSCTGRRDGSAQRPQGRQGHRSHGARKCPCDRDVPTLPWRQSSFQTKRPSDKVIIIIIII